MDKKIREAQKDILKCFTCYPGGFALAGGTALELYYLQHRFSFDLDFFSSQFNVNQIENIIKFWKEKLAIKITLESELVTPGKARVQFYTMNIKNSKQVLKIDFIEDVLFKHPHIKRIDKVPVYSVESIYLQKIMAISGVRFYYDQVGRFVQEGRRQARDVFDLYMLSKKIEPLHIFLKKVSEQFQRGIIYWYQTFSRQDLMLSLLDLDIYDKNFDGKEMIIYLDDQIRKFTRGMLL